MFTIRSHLHGPGSPAHTISEVKQRERGRKKAAYLGSGRSQAPGDPIRADGESNQEPLNCSLNAKCKMMNAK